MFARKLANTWLFYSSCLLSWTLTCWASHLTSKVRWGKNNPLPKRVHRNRRRWSTVTSRLLPSHLEMLILSHTHTLKIMSTIDLHIQISFTTAAVFSSCIKLCFIHSIHFHIFVNTLFCTLISHPPSMSVFKYSKTFQCTEYWLTDIFDHFLTQFEMSIKRWLIWLTQGCWTRNTNIWSFQTHSRYIKILN